MSHSLLAHIYKNQDNTFLTQSLEEHLQGTASYASHFLAPIDMQQWGFTLGWLHDIGKAKGKFQSYIQNISGYLGPCQDEDTYDKTQVDHATEGAAFCDKYYTQDIAYLLKSAIIAHHRGLMDYDAQAKKIERLKEILIFDIPDLPELSLPVHMYDLKAEEKHHLVRVLYSALVDADYLDTERFMSKHIATLRSSIKTLSVDTLLEKLESHLDEKTASLTKINKVYDIRQTISTQCAISGTEAQGIYSLTVPTGGGKTLASMRWALHHAKTHGLNRIIVAIPYASVISQTAAKYRRIFGEENVLEHHSNVELDGYNKLASENWDVPIIVTTNVLLFESMYSSHPSMCRKLHNLINSVIILDEAQAFPSAFLQPIVDALGAYSRLFRTSILLTSATQPTLANHQVGVDTFTGLPEIHEVIPNPRDLFQALRRTDIHVIDSRFDHESLALRIRQYKRVLCIVNSTDDAKALYNRLPKVGTTLYLSRLMCSDHIEHIIKRLKRKLKKNDEVIRVIATPLIEAGVDIDLPVVFREYAGLDSIVQAAGRCNRDGYLESNGQVYVFHLSDTAEGYIRSGQLALSALNTKHPDADYQVPSTMNKYYHELYQRVSSFDEAQVKPLISTDTQVRFREAAKRFKLVGDDAIPVVVHWRKGLKIIHSIQGKLISRETVRALQRYSVELGKEDIERLSQLGCIEKTHDIWIQRDIELYRKDIGLDLEDIALKEAMVL